MPVLKAEPERLSQVSEQFSRLESSLKVLRDRVDSLGARLAPVLQARPVDTKKEATTDIHLCPMADRLRGIWREMSELNDSLNTITECLEL